MAKKYLKTVATVTIVSGLANVDSGTIDRSDLINNYAGCLNCKLKSVVMICAQMITFVSPHSPTFVKSSAIIGHSRIW